MDLRHSQQLTICQQTPKRVTTTKTVTLGTITKRAYTVIPTVVTKTKTLTCSIPRRQPHRDPWARITPTVAFAAALETGPSTASATATGAPRGRRDAFRRVAEDRAEFLAAREARLAGAVIEKRGLDNATATVTELDTAKWVASTSWATAPATTVTMSTEATTSVTTTSTSTVYSGVTKVLITVTAVSFFLTTPSGYQILIPPGYTHEDKDQLHHCQDHIYNHEAPDGHRHYQDGARIKHCYLQGKGWQASLSKLRAASHGGYLSFFQEGINEHCMVWTAGLGPGLSSWKALLVDTAAKVLAFLSFSCSKAHFRNVRLESTFRTYSY